ncbi:hypothetical protein H7I02_13310 [Mycolicibacterium brumae]|nr:hypothetical protein [Mycolicibacterium brumae]
MRPLSFPALRSPVLIAAFVLVAAQLVVRGVLAFGGYYYWDDLILVGRAGTNPLLSFDFLFHDHDGHVMPGAFLLSGLISKAAPLVWAWPAASLVVLQLLASLALVRALWVIVGNRAVLLVPLTFALFTPLGVPSFAWWAAGLNALPLQAALAWVTADAILLARTGNRRYAATGALVFFGGLLFFEKSAVIPFVAFAVVALLTYVQTDKSLLQAAADVWRRGAVLWVSLLAITVAWVALYTSVVDQRRWSTDLPMTWQLLRRSFTHGIVPGLVGGPWQWQRWDPASPWGVPPTVVIVLGWVALAAAVAVSMARKQKLAPVWLTALGYAVACQIPIYLMRSSPFTALELAQTLRYYPDLVVVLALLAAVGFCAPNRSTAQAQAMDTSPARTAAVLAVMAGFLFSSLYSTATFLTSWRDNPTKSYLQNAEAALARAARESDAPLLDQEVDPMILQRIQHPENMFSHMFALLRDRPEFASATTRPRMFDSRGRMLDAQVTWVRLVKPGPVPDCGYLVQTDFPVELPLDGPLLPSDWTAEFNYLANSVGSLTMSLDDGPQVKVPVQPGLNRVFIRIPGAGQTITVEATTAALTVCLASGPVGNLAPTG